MKRIFSHTVIIILISCVLLSVVGCSSKRAGDFEGNFNELGWDDITTSAYDDTIYYENCVISASLYDINIISLTSCDVDIVEQKDVSNYFDEDKIYERLGLKFDYNKLLLKFAAGTGVIVICLVLHVATMGTSTTIACIATGAFKGAITGAASGAVIGGIVGGISSYISSDFDFNETLKGTIEGVADGYAWGAICGAISGAYTSSYCFVKGTKVKTELGSVPIEEVKIGDKVWSYNQDRGKNELKTVKNTYHNTTQKLTKIKTSNSEYISTPSHSYFANKKYIIANNICSGDVLFKSDFLSSNVSDVTTYDVSITDVYNIEVEDNHNYYIGDEEVLVHNACPLNSDYAGKTKEFGSEALKKKYGCEGVEFKANGYPKFEPFAKKSVVADPPSIAAKQAGTCFTGNNTVDFKLANKLAGFGDSATAHLKQFPGYTWHHVEDMKTLILVPSDVHTAALGLGGVAHSGGASLLREFFKNL